jgi:hypothetical protein
MLRNHRSRSFAPSVNPLEGRTLLSGMTATSVFSTTTPVYAAKHKLTSVTLMGQVESTTGTIETTATGTMTFEMVMSHAMKGMKGMMKMPAGTTVLGTETLSKGMGMVTVPAKDALKMHLEIIYSGDSNFMSSSVSPVVTRASLKGFPEAGMGSMKM